MPLRIYEIFCDDGETLVEETPTEWELGFYGDETREESVCSYSCPKCGKRITVVFDEEPYRP